MKAQARRPGRPACPAQLHLLLDKLSQSTNIFQLPAITIVSRHVAVVYAMQLDLAEPHSSLMTKLAFISQARPLGLREFSAVERQDAALILSESAAAAGET